MAAPVPPAQPKSASWMIMVVAGFAVLVAVVVTGAVVLTHRGNNLAGKATPTPASQGVPTVVRDTNAGFTIQFPEAAPVPVVTLIPGTTRQETVYQTTDGFSVSWTRFSNPADVADPPTRLMAAVNGAAKAVKGSVIGPPVAGTVDDAPSLTFTVAAPSGSRTFYVKSMVVLRASTLYTVETFDTTPGVPAFTAFAASFHLTTAPSPTAVSSPSS